MTHSSSAVNKLFVYNIHQYIEYVHVYMVYTRYNYCQSECFSESNSMCPPWMSILCHLTVVITLC